MLPAVLRRGAGRLLPRHAAAFATGAWIKPHLGLELPLPGDARLRTVTVLPGDGVGPEVIKAAQEAIAATGARRAAPPGVRGGGSRLRAARRAAAAAVSPATSRAPHAAGATQRLQPARRARAQHARPPGAHAAGP